MCLYVHVCGYMHVSAVALRVQKGASDPWRECYQNGWNLRPHCVK